MTAYVEVQFAVEDDSTPTADEIALWVNRAISAADSAAESEVTVRVVGLDEMQQLNSEFRDQDKSTNVLSFPAGEPVGLPVGAVAPLGDVLVCANVVRSEAASQGKNLRDHWAHMIVHGTLHLLGFDHIDDAEALKMEQLEVLILHDHGIENPYGESPKET